MTDPIAHGIDYAWAQVPAPAIALAGAKFAVRYLTGSARLTPIERDNLHAAGIAILLVVEQEADAAEKGYARGRQLAQIGNDEANQLGYPESCPLLYADDKNDPDTSQEVDFMHGVKSPGGRSSDMYSGGNVLAALSRERLSPFGGWMVETWFPNSGADPFMTQLANTRDPIHILGVPDDQFDTNILHRSVPMWGPDGVVHLDSPSATSSESPKRKRNPKMWIAYILALNYCDVYYNGVLVDGFKNDDEPNGFNVGHKMQRYLDGGVGLTIYKTEDEYKSARGRLLTSAGLAPK